MILKSSQLKLGPRIEDAWSETEDSILTRMWALASHSELRESLPMRTKSAIKNRATKLKLKRDTTQQLSNVAKLLNESFEAFYWIGFLLADGSVDAERIRLHLGVKDSDHLMRYMNFIEFGGTVQHRDGKIVGVDCSNKNVANSLEVLYGFNDSKTYIAPNPALYDSLTTEQLLAIVIGFIDGDGSINITKNRGKPRIVITSHSEWENLFRYWDRRLTEDKNLLWKPCKIRSYRSPSMSCSMAIWGIYRLHHVISLKNSALRMKLPILQRKWNRIV